MDSSMRERMFDIYSQRAKMLTGQGRKPKPKCKKGKVRRRVMRCMPKKGKGYSGGYYLGQQYGSDGMMGGRNPFGSMSGGASQATWLKFVKRIHKRNPHLTYKKALQVASKRYPC